MFYRCVRPWLFQLDAEQAHERALSWVERAARNDILRETCAALWQVRDARLAQELFCVRFPNPVGLAAGFDKNGVGVGLWPALGFGFVEIGTVTPRPQPGNEPPRLFRLPDERALINRMGFNNDGALRVAARVPPPPHGIPIGVNLGKQKTTPLENAADDYLTGLKVFDGRADFFVINVSSPNTPGLRQLQQADQLDALLGRIRAAAPAVPLLLKVAPDLTTEQLSDIVALVRQHRLNGIVATNTTIQHSRAQEGGLSGAPLRDRATECVRQLYRLSGGAIPIIGVGGIFRATDAWEKICAGASLVEVYTGLVYEGPGLAAAINRGLLRQLEAGGFTHLREAVGCRA
ncbi:MAG: quinone-dependent dihydroorotate dehydrogenase [Verrucomicrobiae bacterium]|nr:quinone-dependent dihydroorotate dehydrogenase [Verrucomicrobiae bacterium]MDW8343863.1 quinone-dependent dihydroorotate dehydrogenase [Verrucomicrobiae bacterium]